MKPLTIQQRNIVVHLATGLSAREIGGRLGLSGRTVETHVRNLSDKLKAQNRIQIVVEALLEGYVSLSELRSVIKRATPEHLLQWSDGDAG